MFQVVNLHILVTDNILHFFNLSLHTNSALLLFVLGLSQLLSLESILLLELSNLFLHLGVFVLDELLFLLPDNLFLFKVHNLLIEFVVDLLLRLESLLNTSNVFGFWSTNLAMSQGF
jgi:hypothetical protein